MVLEVANIDVLAGSEADFVAAYRGARHLLLASGCHSAQMTQGIESPQRFVLLVQWDSVQQHQENFRDTDLFVQWRAAIGPYFANPPLVEHFLDV
ncbi:quinol monooxygenase YgiN [Jatrophihabitans sp. GAS493]|uniref:antibiotic biosynthesis monooxygenase family protein n=1 Tax=Jatrophihabitans sp. GAS493 TaxID=1907575 RepID=UPI000BB8ACEC|nr:antibiotic biosynthesis monooxygenase family protein [Jatrophihabitans sp. GAS493]SOD74034.1 quinol monooxygenase YgiN [Jatrophihabitans sp. GAS493]